MNWIKRVFHKHKLHEVYRKKISVCNITSNDGCMVDVQPATTYMGTFVCEECFSTIDRSYTILDIFDRVQPYDKEINE